MFNDERANSSSSSLPHNLMTLAVAVALTGALVLIGCDSNDVSEEPEVEIAAVAITPDSASIEVGESVDFSVVALTASGDTIPDADLRDADLDIEWWSTDTDVFTVEAGGIATGQTSGTALCMVEATGESVIQLETTSNATGKMAHSTLRPFTGRDSAFVSVLF